MTIGNVSSMQSVGGAAFNPATLTPEGLLAYCSATLNNLDAQITQRMNAQQNATAQQKQIGEVVSQLQTFAMGVENRPDHRDGNQSMAWNLANLYKKTSDPTTLAAIERAYKATTGHELKGPDGQVISYAKYTDVPVDDAYIKNNPVSNEQWQQLAVTPVKQAQENLAKGSDLAMIEIQSLVSKRQLGIQLTTQIMQSANEGTKGVVGNIGR